MNKIIPRIGLIIVLIFFTIASGFSQKLKPYTIGAMVEGSIENVSSLVKEKLEANGFEVLGAYHPVNDKARYIVAFTSDEIKSAVSKIGGLSGFAAAWRIGITEEGGKVNISYNTPEYWGNAYFRSDYDKVSSAYNSIAGKIKNAMAECGDGGGAQYGSEKGLDAKRLRNYRYKVLMPQFDDTQVLQKFDSYEEAVATIDKNLNIGIKDLTTVYSVEFKDQKLKLYGIGLSGEDGEGKFMPKIDLGTPKHTAFLPYEFLVVDNKVHMLHGRYRIALSFPDLSLGTFMKIVSTPGDIKDLLEQASDDETE